MSHAVSPQRPRRELMRAALLFAALTLVFMYSLALDLAGTMYPLGPDGNLFMWTLAWDSHAFVRKPLAIFDANIFFPHPNTLAYSENLIGSAFFAAPILWLTGNPVLALNIVALLTCFLCGFGAYVLARRLGMSPAAAAIAGLVFAFSPPRFFRTGQLHLGAVQWIPFGLAFLHRYLDEGRRRDLRIAAALFSLQALTTGHGAAFMTLAVAALLLYRVALGEPVAVVRRIRDLGIAGVLLLVPSVLVYLPYRRVQVDMGLRRSLENWAVTPESFIASPSHLHQWIVSVFSRAPILETASAFLFPGYLPLLLALACVLWRGGPARGDAAGSRRDWRRHIGAIAVLALDLVAVLGCAVGLAIVLGGPLRLKVGDSVWFSARDSLRAWLLGGAGLCLRLLVWRWVPFAPFDRAREWVAALAVWRESRRQDPVVFYALLTAVSVWLSIGPPLGLWPVVYDWPGLSFVRVPSRFTILGMLGLAMLAGFGFERLAATQRGRTRLAVAALIGVLLVAEFAAFPMPVIPSRVDPQPADAWLSTVPAPLVVAELPIADPANAGAFERRQTEFMLHSIAHWGKTVHGYSGIRPREHEELYIQLRSFPDDTSLQSLARFGVTHVVVHTDLYPPGEWDGVQERIRAFNDRLRLKFAAGTGRVYELAAR